MPGHNDSQGPDHTHTFPVHLSTRRRWGGFYFWAMMFVFHSHLCRVHIIDVSGLAVGFLLIQQLNVPIVGEKGHCIFIPGLGWGWQITYWLTDNLLAREWCLWLVCRMVWETGGISLCTIQVTQSWHCPKGFLFWRPQRFQPLSEENSHIMDVFCFLAIFIALDPEFFLIPNWTLKYFLSLHNIGKLWGMEVGTY